MKKLKILVWSYTGIETVHYYLAIVVWKKGHIIAQQLNLALVAYSVRATALLDHTQ